jgi:hypothetical protein
LAASAIQRGGGVNSMSAGKTLTNNSLASSCRIGILRSEYGFYIQRGMYVWCAAYKRWGSLQDATEFMTYQRAEDEIEKQEKRTMMYTIYTMNGWLENK